MSSLAEVDPFKIVFDAFQTSLSSFSAEESQLKSSAIDAIEYKLLQLACKDLVGSAEYKKDRIQKLRRKVLNGYDSKIAYHSHMLHSVEHSCTDASEVCRRLKYVIDRRNESLVNTAERRMRELVYEITGEYGKSDIRIKRRRKFLLLNARLNLAWSIWHMRWKRLALRLDHTCAVRIGNLVLQAPSIKPKAAILCCRNNKSEIANIEGRIRDKLASIPNTAADLSNRSGRPIFAIRVGRPRQQKSTLGAANPQLRQLLSGSPMTAATFGELVALLEILLEAVAGDCKVLENQGRCKH
jgi:hypothetical protein